ncbi:hypothetical protein HYDPIDRAFT_107257 [Hydnomerulius pinastri MD-312]|nr:hypothetical protein HYDPIDRAFT_107257 [Hydnomerulius pinastri MD-312]
MGMQALLVLAVADELRDGRDEPLSYGGVVFACVRRRGFSELMNWLCRYRVQSFLREDGQVSS